MRINTQDKWFPYVVAFLSGMCALIYEIVWMRTFTPVFGLSIYATTAVLCAFMGGLGIGSYIAPRVIDKWKPSIWTLYALLEVGIGVCAIFIPYSVKPITGIFVAVSGVFQVEAATTVTRFLLSFIVMALPTFFMGLTLPVLVRAVRDRTSEEHRTGSKHIGLLYGFNTVGGAIGCLLTGFLLIYSLGIQATVYITAMVNILLGAVIYLLKAKEKRTAPGAEQAADEHSETREMSPIPTETRIFSPVEAAVMNPPLLLFFYGLVGFVSFGYELCWFRILIFYLQSATYSFSIMLVIFLLGIGLGSLFYSRVLEKRLQSKPPLQAAKMLGTVQILIGLMGIGTLHIYKYLLPVLWKGMVQILGADTWLMILFQKVAITSLVIFPPTFLMGIAFPLFARLYKGHGKGDARAVGHLYAANTLGAISGSLVTGFVLFNLIGLQHSLTLLGTCSFLVGLIFALKPLKEKNKYRWWVGGLAAIFIIIFTATPSRLLISNFESYTGKISYYKESATDITFVYTQANEKWLAFHDGRGTSSTNAVVNYVNRLLAYTTMLMNPKAQDVLVISMGCGNTASAFSKFPIRSLDLVDISSGPFEAAQYFHTNEKIMEDPRVTAFVEDGRNFLLKSKKKYDIIQLELPTLHTDGVVFLYTREFYDIAYSKLKEGGVLSQWLDAKQTGRETSYLLLNTMKQKFPNSTVWAARWAWWMTGVKGREPVRIDYEESRALFSRPEVAADLSKLGVRFEQVVSKLVSAGAWLEQAVGPMGTISDDYTVADYKVPRLRNPEAFGGGVAYYNSPFRSLFLESWRKHGADVMDQEKMFPFYDGPEHRRRVRDSIFSIVKGFPRGELLKILNMSGEI